MTTPTKPAPAFQTGSPRNPADGRVAASIDAWKRKLLDLSKRNRALNFRATKVSTVSVVEEHPAEAFRMLYLAEREMRFKATEPPPESTAAVTTPSDDAAASIDQEQIDEVAAQPEFVPY